MSFSLSWCHFYTKILRSSNSVRGYTYALSHNSLTHNYLGEIKFANVSMHVHILSIEFHQLAEREGAVGCCRQSDINQEEQ